MKVVSNTRYLLAVAKLAWRILPIMWKVATGRLYAFREESDYTVFLVSHLDDDGDQDIAKLRDSAEAEWVLRKRIRNIHRNEHIHPT